MTKASKKGWTVAYVSDVYGKKDKKKKIKGGGCGTMHGGRLKGSANLGGRYVGQPGQAVRKAFTRICNKSSIRGVCTLIIGMKHGDKVKYYKVKRFKLDKPVELEINGKMVPFKYKSTSKYLGKDYKP